MPAAVVVEARAKLNLGLAIGPRRADGFHDLVTVFQSVSLADTLRLRRRAKGFTLRVRGEDVAASRGRRRRAPAAGVPKGRDNLALRAVRLLAARAGIRGGAEIELVKRIPAGAGLGGGSADAAGALVGLARLYGVRLGRAERSELAAALGSDVPFAVTGGTALGLGRGERLRRLRLARPFRAVIAVPDWRVSTASAFARIDRGKYGLTAWRANLRFGQSIGREGVTADRALRLGNTFESVLGRRRSDFESLRARLRAAGVAQPRLTGSGSAVFGILGPGSAGNSVVTRFRGNERLFVVRSVAGGVRVTT